MICPDRVASGGAIPEIDTLQALNRTWPGCGRSAGTIGR
jgi:hypothetical protein